MRRFVPILACFVAAGSMPAQPARGASCADDYLTIETVRGRILEIKPAPEPFKTADIYFSGPSPCDRIWMQVLKTDAARCRAGMPIVVTGVVTMDVENQSWEIGPTKSEYMTPGVDFTCG
ncbi:MAG TPA: hypothetical protein VGM72_07375 [Micropepsaceae bacterium]